MMLFDSAKLFPRDQTFEDLSEEQVVALNAEAELFTWSGLSSLVEWKSLTDMEKAALVNAYERKLAAQAMQLARALSGVEGLLDTASTLDGGATTDRISLATAVAKAAKKYQGTLA